MRRSAAVYKFPNFYLTHPYGQTNAGVWTASEPYEVVAMGTDDVGLGEAVVRALETSAALPRIPDSRDVNDRRLIAAAGHRSWKEFFELSAMCQVNTIPADPTAVLVGATKKHPTQLAWVPVADDTRVEMSDPAAVGFAVRAALS